MVESVLIGIGVGVAGEIGALLRRLWVYLHDVAYDNRRDGDDDRPSCLDLVLALLRNILRGDFSEYNAKNYQEESRWALLNLCTYAYDHEVRLAARMVLDYLSAHMAVSTNDLRRMVPFRRRNEGKNAARNARGFMRVSLIGEPGSDPMAPYFAIQAGNTRSCVAKVSFAAAIGLGGRPGTAETRVWGLSGSRPFKTLAAASTAVAPHGTIRVVPGVSHERAPIAANKRFTLVAPIASVKIGVI